ncbi:hypothetical protein Dsin_019549 [Dipteronia sinensis]|uniref:Uncharacterized protein n=1 Tax=Dipteronia sinensis TaxID=43782 RepID=A0AAE0A8U7_9ROSI|nr:hypothetical protein Dsin_019549 [Dipteronia sinensis]
MPPPPVTASRHAAAARLSSVRGRGLLVKSRSFSLSEFKIKGNGTSYDDCSDDVCTNDAPTCSSSGSLLDRRFVIGVLKFCSNEKCLELGRRYHTLIIKSEVSVNQFVGTSLVGMFAKFGDMSLLVARLTPDFVNLTPVY